jgi:hypothetical protein
MAENKPLISFLSALVFLIVAHPQTFKLMRRIVGEWVSNKEGCPTHAGLFLHAFVFMVITYLMMLV